MAMAVIATLVIGQAHAGFLVVLLALPLTVWLAWSAYVIVRYPYARLAQMVAVLVWCLAFLVLAAAHYVRHEFVRSDADRVVREIRRYMVDFGRCPLNLEILGFKRDDLLDRLGENYSYSCEISKPKFAYVATFSVFDTFDYDFEGDRWRYMSWAEKKKFLDTRPAAMDTPQANPSAPVPAQGSRPVPHRAP